MKTLTQTVAILTIAALPMFAHADETLTTTPVAAETTTMTVADATVPATEAVVDPAVTPVAEVKKDETKVDGTVTVEPAVEATK